MMPDQWLHVGYVSTGQVGLLTSFLPGVTNHFNNTFSSKLSATITGIKNLPTS